MWKWSKPLGSAWDDQGRQIHHGRLRAFNAGDVAYQIAGGYMIEAQPVRILREVMPSRTLLNGKRYTNAANTDIRKTFIKFERLARMQARKGQA
jgi:hypothetical protein